MAAQYSSTLGKRPCLEPLDQQQIQGARIEAGQLAPRRALSGVSRIRAWRRSEAAITWWRPPGAGGGCPCRAGLTSKARWGVLEHPEAQNRGPPGAG